MRNRNQGGPKARVVVFRTAGKPRVAQPPQRDNVVADPISLPSPGGCPGPREKRRRRGAQCAPGGRLVAAPTEDMEHCTWEAAGHQAADFGLKTAVGKCLLLRTWFQAGVSAALHMRPAQCPRERRAHTVRPYGRTDTGRRSMRPAGGWQPPLRRAETIVPSSFYRIRCPGLRFCGRLPLWEKGGQAHGEDKLGAPRPPATKNSQ